jgi:hypothetical protein
MSLVIAWINNQNWLLPVSHRTLTFAQHVGTFAVRVSQAERGNEKSIRFALIRLAHAYCFRRFRNKGWMSTQTRKPYCARIAIATRTGTSRNADSISATTDLGRLTRSSTSTASLMSLIVLTHVEGPVRVELTKFLFHLQVSLLHPFQAFLYSL